MKTSLLRVGFLLLVLAGLGAVQAFTLMPAWSLDATSTQGTSTPKELHDCEAVTLESKLTCWDDLLSYTLKEKGFSAAFELFIKLYQTEPELPKGCHGWGHALGSAAYDLYTEGKEVEFRPETSYCGYGFYHGFLERFIEERGSVSGTRAFCVSIAEESERGKEGVFKNCIHGIGHGNAAGLAENLPLLRGDLQKGVDLGSAACRSVTNDPKELRDCFDGVLNELVVDMFQDQYGFSRDRYITEQDPLAFCRMQLEELKPSCYFEFMGIFGYLFDGDFARAAAFVDSDITNDEHAAIAIKKLAADFLQNDIVKNDYAPNVDACRSLRETLVKPCIQGIQVGFLAHGEPGKEWERGFPFCASSLLNDSERPNCYQSMLYQFRETYDKSLFTKVCGLAPAKYRAELCSSVL